MQWQGCGTALVTPFTQDGAIDESALRNLIAWQVESGIDFLVPCGTTGETPTLSHDEWLHVIDHCKAIESVLTDGQIGETYHVGRQEEKQDGKTGS